MYGSLENFPLRQVNFVKTRTSVLKAVTRLLKKKTIDEITVDEICKITKISRGTFFNYFPHKDYVFYYYLKIFTIKIAQRIKLWEPDISFRDQLTQIYIWFSEESQYPGFVSAFIKYLLDEGEFKNDVKLTVAEFVYFFNGIEGEKEYVYYNGLTIEDIIQDLCSQAKANGEIPLDIDASKLGKVFLAFLLVPFIADKTSKTEVLQEELFNIILDIALDREIS